MSLPGVKSRPPPLQAKAKPAGLGSKSAVTTPSSVAVPEVDIPAADDPFAMGLHDDESKVDGRTAVLLSGPALPPRPAGMIGKLLQRATDLEQSHPARSRPASASSTRRGSRTALAVLPVSPRTAGSEAGRRLAHVTAEVPASAIGTVEDGLSTVHQQSMNSLALIFQFYAKLFDPRKALCKSAPSYEEIRFANETISKGEVISFARDFQLVPDIISRTDLLRVWDAQAAQAQDIRFNALKLSQFEEFLVRLALVAWGHPPRLVKAPAARVQELVKFLHLDDLNHVRQVINTVGKHTQTQMNMPGGDAPTFDRDITGLRAERATEEKRLLRVATVLARRASQVAQQPAVSATGTSSIVGSDGVTLPSAPGSSAGTLRRASYMSLVDSSAIQRPLSATSASRASRDDGSRSVWLKQLQTAMSQYTPELLTGLHAEVATSSVAWTTVETLALHVGRITVGKVYQYRLCVVNVSAETVFVNVNKFGLPSVSLEYMGKALAPGLSVFVKVAVEPLMPTEESGDIVITVQLTGGGRIDTFNCPVSLRAVPPTAAVPTVSPTAKAPSRPASSLGSPRSLRIAATAAPSGAAAGSSRA